MQTYFTQQHKINNILNINRKLKLLFFIFQKKELFNSHFFKRACKVSLLMFTVHLQK